jgi:ABC-type antimicrobial peptide transport system permease subunit
MALGARRAHIFGAVLGQGLRLIGAGLAAGLLLTVWTTGLLQSVLFGIGPEDVPTHIWVIVGIAVVGALANLVPASRAAAISPIDALHSE